MPKLSLPQMVAANIHRAVPDDTLGASKGDSELSCVAPRSKEHASLSGMAEKVRNGKGASKKPQ